MNVMIPPTRRDSTTRIFKRISPLYSTYTLRVLSINFVMNGLIWQNLHAISFEIVAIIPDLFPYTHVSSSTTGCVGVIGRGGVSIDTIGSSTVVGVGISTIGGGVGSGKVSGVGTIVGTGFGFGAGLGIGAGVGFGSGIGLIVGVTIGSTIVKLETLRMLLLIPNPFVNWIVHVEYVPLGRVLNTIVFTPAPMNTEELIHPPVYDRLPDSVAVSRYVGLWFVVGVETGVVSDRNGGRMIPPPPPPPEPPPGEEIVKLCIVRILLSLPARSVTYI